MKKKILYILGLFLTISLMNDLQAQVAGGVYVMSNGEGQVQGIEQGPNSIVAYAQDEDGTLTLIGSYPTGGNGGDFDGGEGLDPLISAYAITKSNDNKFVLAVNAGSNSVTVMRVNEDYSLDVVDTESTQDIGPNSIAYVPSKDVGVNGIVYVSNITSAEYLDLGEPGQQGSVVGYRLMNSGDLVPIEGSRRALLNRPSAVQISPDGDFLVVASINSGSSALESNNQDEIVVYRIGNDGLLTDQALSGATSTLRDNAEGRNLPSAIGFQIVGDNYVVVTEAREFRPDGTPPIFPGLQDGSVSTWQIGNDGSLTPINLDVASGENNTGRTACWLDFSDENTFFVSNAIEAGLASYSFNDGEIELIDQVAAQGTGATGNTTDPALAFSTTDGWIDLWISDDGQYLYQAYGLTGEVGVFEIDGAELTLIQEIEGDLPTNNIQGIVSVGAQPSSDELTATYRLTFDALWSQTSHPQDFPVTPGNEARWSPVAGLTHNNSVTLFNEGEVATPGIVNISQTGSRDPLDTELANVILTGAGETYIESNTRVRPSPDTISTSFEVSSSHSLLSVTSMIAPSPDWVVALKDFELLRNGEFIESAVASFLPYDTGSDSGESFASANEDTQPREPITMITDGVLEMDGSIRNLGFWRLERIDAESNCDVAGGSLIGGPFTFNIDGLPDNIPSSAISLEGNAGSNNQVVITDDSGNILSLPTSFDGPNFDVAGEGLGYIYNVAFEDGLEGLEIGNNLTDLEGCFSLSNEIYVNKINGNNNNIVGAVYAMSNGQGQVAGIEQGPNSIVAYGQSEDGTLTLMGEFPTGGNGGDFDGGEGLDPLISAYAVAKSLDNRFVIAVNAGSNSVTAMSVNDDFTLEVTDTQTTIDMGPNSVAYTPSSLPGVNGLVYVSNITQEEFLTLGEPGHQGSVVGYWLLDDGTLQVIEDSRRTLETRPSAVQFSPAGDYLVAASINSGASGLGSGSEDEIVLYSVNADGTLSANQLDGTTSTLRDNAEGRNLPSAIGFQIVQDNYVVVTEAREFQPNGAPPAFPALQDGSVSTWQIVDGAFVPVNLDVASGENNTGRTACWLDFSDENTFFVSNAIEAGLASYSFNDGQIELLDQVAAQGTGATGNTTDPASAFGTTEGWIDLWISDDGNYLYQAYGLTGEVGVYEINGTELTLLQEIGGLPQNNIQGIVSVGGKIGVGPNNPAVAAVYAMSNGQGQVDGIVQGPNSIVAYAQAENGTLTLMGEFPTGGNGGDFDGGEGLDPLISAYAITKSNDNRFVLAVNAGSNTVTSMRVSEDDFSLEVVDTEETIDIGPNSIAYVPSRKLGVNGVVYVSNISRQEFLDGGEPEQQGSIIGYYLLDNGDLVPLEGSRRELANRPSAVQISPDGDFLVVSSINSGSSVLASDNQDEIVVYGLDFNGMVTESQLSGATSTLRDNAEGRNLPSAIGFQIVGENYVVVTEAREFRPDGTPPIFPALQDGSVSTWQIENDGSLTAINLDVASGENNTGRTACWLDFSDENTFFVSNAIEAGLASYSFNDGQIELLDQVAAQGTGATGNTTDPAAAFGTTDGWIDLWISDDGRYLYQAYGLTGEVGVFEIDGVELTQIQEIGGLPSNNIQGIVAVGAQPSSDEATAQYRVTFDALWSEATHPVDWPFNPRWSPVAGLTHDDSYRLFEEGDLATQGLVNISQTGSRDPIDSELANVILDRRGEFYIESNTRVRPSPDTISTTFEISSSHPLVSLTSMIAPSPDWVVSVRDLNLLQDNGEFVDRMIVQFLPFDTGSDSGDTYESENQDTQPREGISEIVDGVLSYNGDIASTGIWRFERIDGNTNCVVDGGNLKGGPFTFCMDGTDDFITTGALSLDGATGAQNVWVITDDHGVITNMVDDIFAMEFESLGEGVSHIYNLSSDTDVEGAEVGNNIADLRGCFGLSLSTYVSRTSCDAVPVGAVYAMSNGEGQIEGVEQGPNSIVGYLQEEDGRLTPLGAFPTGGNGGDFDGGEGLDPLISAYAITKTNDNRFVLAVNAGSNTVTSMRIENDYSLTNVSTESTLDIGPNSIAYVESSQEGISGLVYVANITREEFLSQGEPAQQGSVTGYWLTNEGNLVPIEGSTRDLLNRPSAVQFSPNGEFLVVASINSGSIALASDNQDEIVVYGVNSDGTLTESQLSGATSTLRDNAEGRNLPSAIGFQIVQDNYVVVTEAREFRPDGTPPIFPGLQDGSVSTWQIQEDGSLTAINLDVASGENNTGRTACWLDFSDENTFFVSNAIEAGLASYSFENGQIELIDQVAAQGTGATGNTTDPAAAFGTTQGWIDLWISDDGNYLYQAYGLSGQIGVFEIDGTALNQIQLVSGDLPINNIQGIVSVGEIGTVSATNESERLANSFQIDVFPNPNDGSALNIEFELDRNEEYTITVLDLNGRQVANSIKSGIGQAGSNSVNFDNLSLPSGVFVVKIDTESAISIGRFVVQN